MKEELLEDIQRHIDYTNAMNQKSMRDIQLETLFNYYKELQQRIDKAIEEIKYFDTMANHLNDEIYLDETLSNKLLNILEGKDE